MEENGEAPSLILFLASDSLIRNPQRVSQEWVETETGLSLESYELSFQCGSISNAGPFLPLRCLGLGAALLHPGNAVSVPPPSLAGLTTAEKLEPGAPRFMWGEQPEKLIGREKSVINYGR